MWRSVCLSILTLLLFVSGSGSERREKQKASMDSLEIGAMNAVKKAHQMTDLEFVPLSRIVANEDKTYKAGKLYKGLMYSSVKETNTFVGMDVSFHTFMTALHNPKSVLYTDNVSKLPYHGSNCGAYYGTVCSGLINYALGIDIYSRSYDIPKTDEMELVPNQSVSGLKVADVLWRRGHVVLVTEIVKDKNGKIDKIEICQAQHGGCHRSYMSSESINEMLANGKWQVYRYKNLKKNTTYMPLTEFVAVEGEEKIPFTYNDDICTNKGDKACYVCGEKVVLNLAQGFKTVEVYKDSVLYKKVNVGKIPDIELKDLPYGDYMARAINDTRKSDFTRWKVIDVNVRVDKADSKVYFSSSNSIPVYMEFSSINGFSLPKNVYVFSEEDIRNGFKYVDNPILQGKQKKKGHTYLKVHFECDYGRVINRPINLAEKVKK